MVAMMGVSAAAAAPAHAIPDNWMQVPLTGPAGTPLGEPSYLKQVDPIIAWNVPQSGHPHSFVVNAGVNYNSTTAQLMAAGTTSPVSSFKTAIWMPSVIAPDGTQVPIRGGVNRFINEGNVSAGVKNVNKPPNGLDYIHGDSHKTTTTGLGDTWACIGVANTPQATIPATCPAGATGIRWVAYQGKGCWNGVDLGPGLGRSTGPADAQSHMWNDVGFDCPGGVRIPQISTIFEWDTRAIGGRLSSDAPGAPPASSVHTDQIYFDGVDRLGNGFWDRALSMCLNHFRPDGQGTFCTYNASGDVIRQYDGAVVLDT